MRVFGVAAVVVAAEVKGFESNVAVVDCMASYCQTFDIVLKVVAVGIGLVVAAAVAVADASAVALIKFVGAAVAVAAVVVATVFEVVLRSANQDCCFGFEKVWSEQMHYCSPDL